MKIKKLQEKAAEDSFALYEVDYSHQLIRQLSIWKIELEYVRLVDNSLDLFGKIEWKKGKSR